jgi:hypothetical protein
LLHLLVLLFTWLNDARSYILKTIQITFTNYYPPHRKQTLSPLQRCITATLQTNNRRSFWGISSGKGKGHAHNRPQEPKGVPGRLRPRIFLTFGTTRAVGRQPHAPAAFTPRGNPWYSFLEAETTPGHMVPSVATDKIPSVTPPGIDPETVRLVAQCLKLLAPEFDI